MKRTCIILFIALTALFANSVQAAIPAETTVEVDCTKGKSIAKALEKKGVSLIIEISGICAENVIINRSGVTLRGTDPAVDGISVGTVNDRVLQISGASIIRIENLKLTGGRFGLSINATFGVTLDNVLIEDSEFGVIAGTASGSLAFIDTTITTTIEGSRGIWATNGSNVRCFGCLVENYRTGALATQASTLEFTGSTVQTTMRAIDANGGSQIVTRFSASPNTFEGGTLPSSAFMLGAMRLRGTASANLGPDTLIGRIEAAQKSSVTLWGTTQTSSTYPNNFTEGSSLVANTTSSLAGNYNAFEFSTANLQFGSTITGALNCSTGADAYCDNPADVSGGSNCGQCPNP